MATRQVPTLPGAGAVRANQTPRSVPRNRRGASQSDVPQRTLSRKADASKHETSFTRKEIISLLQKAGGPDKLDLSGCDLAGINLSRLNLSGADLHGAKLIFAGLHGTDLSGANLKGANLSSARGTTSEQLDKAGSLKDTVMPDGSIHP
jgi:uncharacterized protein YjbI with pentapeptide repeats